MKKSKLQTVKDRFYYKNGEPLLNSFAIFNHGLLPEEVKDYVRVRANNYNIAKYLKKIQDLAGCATCPVVRLDGKEYVLTYRHDIENYCDVIFNNSTFIMD